MYFQVISPQSLFDSQSAPWKNNFSVGKKETGPYENNKYTRLVPDMVLRALCPSWRDFGPRFAHQSGKSWLFPALHQVLSGDRRIFPAHFSNQLAWQTSCKTGILYLGSTQWSFAKCLTALLFLPDRLFYRSYYFLITLNESMGHWTEQEDIYIGPLTSL